MPTRVRRLWTEWALTYTDRMYQTRYPWPLLALLLALPTGPIWAEEGADSEDTPAVEERIAAPSPEALRLGDLGRLHDPGEVLELDANGEPFPALFRAEERGTLLGAVILLHDAGAHADWPGVIGPLRRQLPTLGWATLSLQLPVAPIAKAGDLEADARATARLLEAARPRIAAAVAELNARGIQRIALIGHGSGALAAADYLAENLAAGVGGAVLVGISGVSSPPPLLSPQAVRATETEEPPAEGDAAEKPAPAEVEAAVEEEAPWEPPRSPATLIGLISVPLLDIYGQRDLPQVLSGARRRAAAARGAEGGLSSDQYLSTQRVRTPGNDNSRRITYRQFAMPGADHPFSAHSEALVRRVHGWLKRHLPAR